MRPLALALALALAPLPAAAQSIWARARVRGAEDVARHRDAASVDALFADLPPEALARLMVMFSLDLVEAAELRPERLRRSALAHLDAALALDPDDARTLALAANLYERGGDHARGLRLADRAFLVAPASPDLADVLFTRALATLHLGRYEEARDAWQRSLSEPLSSRTRAITLGNLADTLLVLRDVRGAVDAYRGATEANPESDLAWLGLGVALDRGGVDPTEALSHATEVASEMAGGRGRGTPFQAEALIDSLERPEVFFEPTCERHYHTALAWEAVAREYAPGGRSLTNEPHARELRAAALTAWRAYLRETAPDDPWRPRAELHVRTLEALTR